MRHRLLAAAALAALMLSTQGLVATLRQTTPERADAEFARTVSQGNVAQVELGRLATTKATRDDVKRFAQRLVDDHRTANNELLALAGARTWNISSSMSFENRKLFDRLSGLTGEAFDRTYVAEEVRIHKDTIDLFESRAKGIADTDLWQWTEKTLPAVRGHGQMAKDLQTKLGPGTAN